MVAHCVGGGGGKLLIQLQNISLVLNDQQEYRVRDVVACIVLLYIVLSHFRSRL